VKARPKRLQSDHHRGREPNRQQLLYPGGARDAVVKITNPDGFPVTITAVQLPASTSYAAGYTDSGLSAAISGCSATTPSTVTWNFATSASGSSHTLTSPLTVAGNGALTVTFANDAQMGTNSPAACEGAHFQLPSLTGVTATGGGAGSATTSPATDAWTS
jgi:hypothetical protein